MLNLSKLLIDSSHYGDRLRYSKHSRGTKKGTRKDMGPIVVWNCTRACNLSCKHCYASSDSSKAEYELNTAEAKEFIDDLADYNVPVLLFSGGEPLMRDDLDELIEYAVENGLRVTISTNGTLINEERAEKFKELGVSYVGISLDGLEETNNRFRGSDDAFERALRGIRNCQNVEQKVGLRFTMTDYNRKDIPQIFDLVVDEGISRVCFYHLVHKGRGKELNDAALTNQEKRKVMKNIFDRTEEILKGYRDKEILTVGNHVDGIFLYLKMLKDEDERAEKLLQYLKNNGGNRSGIAIACVDWSGDVHPDQFTMGHTVGNVRERSFGDIWDDEDTLLGELRDRESRVKGRCFGCDWFDLCNGNFRARAEASTDDLWAEDPGCYLTLEELDRYGGGE